MDILKHIKRPPAREDIPQKLIWTVRGKVVYKIYPNLKAATEEHDLSKFIGPMRDRVPGPRGQLIAADRYESPIAYHKIFNF